MDTFKAVPRKMKIFETFCATIEMKVYNKMLSSQLVAARVSLLILEADRDT